MNQIPFITNTFNKYVAQIVNGKKSDKSKPTNRYTINYVENSLYVQPVELNEVNSIIRNLKNKNTFSIVDIPPILIKKYTENLIIPYTLLINQSFQEGCYQVTLKNANCKTNILKKAVNQTLTITDPSHYYQHH